MEALLKDGSASDGHSYSLYWVLILTARPIERHSWKTKVLLMVTLTAYVGSSP